METFFVLVLLATLALGAGGALTAARRFEIAATTDVTDGEEE